jgi:hypothetical protein
MGLGLNLGILVCKAGTLPFEPHLQSILLWLFWRWGPPELFAWVGSEPVLLISAFQIARITGVSHRRPVKVYVLKGNSENGGQSGLEALEKM